METRGWSALRLALWAGLVAGFAESIVRALRRLLFGVPIDLEQHLIWMPAASNALLFTVLGLGLMLGGRWWTVLRRHAVIVGVFAGLAALDVLWLFSPQLSVYASALLAIGIGVQLGRSAGRRADMFDRAVRRSWVGAALLVPASCLGILGTRAWLEHRALAALPRHEDRRPNVLLLVLDTVRRMNVSAYGYYRPTTPNLVRLAQNGVKFERAISTAPWTLASHGSMFTGRWPHELSTDWFSPLDGTWPTVAERLSANGYATGGFVANLSYCNREWGLQRGFMHYESVPWHPAQVLRSSTLGMWVTDLRPIARRLPEFHDGWFRPDAGTIDAEFLDWLDGLKGRPFFAFLNYFDAHRRYSTTPPFDTAFATLTPDSASGAGLPFSLELEAGDMRKYDRAIAGIDHEIGLLLAELDKRGLLKNTLVIVTSDHGEEFMEHGMVGHGNSLYYASLAVPLIVALPGWAPEGRVIAEPVSLRDIAATLLDATGSDREPLPGHSLARFWHDSATGDTLYAEVNHAPNHGPAVPVSLGDLRSVLVGDHHFIKTGTAQRELFDVGLDQWELHDLVNDSAQQSASGKLGTVVDRLPIRDRLGKNHR